MIFDLIRAFAQLNDRYIRRLIFVMVPAALAGLVVLYLLIRGVMGLDLMTQNAWYNIFNPFHWMLRAEFSHGAERAIERLQEQKEYERALRVLETELRNAVPWATRWAWLMLSPVVGLVLATIFMRPICARVDRSFFPHLPRVKERGFERWASFWPNSWRSIFF